MSKTTGSSMQTTRPHHQHCHTIKVAQKIAEMAEQIAEGMSRNKKVEHKGKEEINFCFSANSRCTSVPHPNTYKLGKKYASQRASVRKNVE